MASATTACFGLDGRPSPLLGAVADLRSWTAAADVVFVNAAATDRDHLNEVDARSRAAGSHVVVVAPEPRLGRPPHPGNLRTTYAT